LARSLGAELAVNARAPDAVAQVLKQTGGGAHGVLVTAVSPPAFSQALQFVRRKGTVSLVGLPPGDFATPIFDVVLKRITLRGSIVGTRKDLAEAIEFANVCLWLHRPLEPSIAELFEAINETFKRGGNVIIPTFAVERAQELLYFLGEGIRKGQLAESTQVFLDSPMAISATEIFRRHPECFEPATATLFQGTHDPFDLKGCIHARSRRVSRAEHIHGGAIIVAGSGMCAGGRVRHHLQHKGRDKSAIVFVGYAATGTLARRIIDGAKQVRIFGEDVPVRARIYTINGFSAHADQAELLAWQKQTGAKRTFLVHGEQDCMRQFAAHLADTGIEMPIQNQSYDL
jgi:Cft2 family RNA processing exonuclease